MSAARQLKIGGNQLDDPAFLAGLARFVAAATEPVVILHGGGRAEGEDRLVDVAARGVDVLGEEEEAGPEARSPRGLLERKGTGCSEGKGL